MLLLREVIFYIYGLISAFEDIKQRSIGILPGGIAFAVGTILFFITGGKPADFLLSLIPGALILIMSVLSRGRIGLGDAMFITVSGVFMGVKKNGIYCHSGVVCLRVYRTFCLLMEICVGWI